MSSYIVSFIISCYIITLYNYYKKINSLNNNNQILKVKNEIIKINSICERLELSKINIDNIYIINSHNYINIINIINLLLIIVCIYLYNNEIIIICISSFIIISLVIIIKKTIDLNNIIIDININKFYNEIRNKKDDINKKYIDNLLILLDTSNDINNINLQIDEYILNYSYLDNNIAISILNNINLNNRKDKRIIIIELEQKIIQKKNNEFMDIMNSKLKTYPEITPEIVKYELDDFNIKLDEYKKQLLLKITAINELSQINSIIINISS